MKERIEYIDGLKCLACFGVFFAHFYGAFYTMCNIKPEMNTALLTVLKSPLQGFFDGTFFVYVFCLISGYFAFQKKINSKVELIRCILLRYLRFAMPMIFINFFTLIISRTIGIHSDVIGVPFENTWIIKSVHNVTLVEVIRESVFFTPCDLNGPLWMIRPLFIATTIIYIFKYFSHFIRKEFEYVVVLVILLIGQYYSIIQRFDICTVTFIGAFLKVFISSKRNTSTKKAVSLACLAVFLLLWNGGIHRWLNMYLGITEGIFVYNEFWRKLYALAFTYCVCRSIFLQKILSGKVMKVISKYSFPIYIFHMPIICSFSMLVYSLVIKKLGYSLTFIVNYMLSVLIVLTLSNGFCRYIDPMFQRIIGKINKKS